MALQTFTAGQILTAAQMTTLQTNAYNQTVSTKTASYTLVAADVGTRIVMNSASATTITVNTSLFAAGDTLFIQNIGAGTCTITAGTATVTTAGSLALGTWAGGTLYFTSASAAIFFSGGGTGYGAATGGSSSNITVGGIDYTLLTFTSTGTLTVTKAGFFDYLMVGGGGGNRFVASGTTGGAGGGAGSLVQGSIYLSANQTITIGAGSPTTTSGTRREAGTSSIGTTIYAPGQANDGPDNAAYYVGSGCGTINANPPTALTNGLGKVGGTGSNNMGGGGGGGFVSAGGNAGASSGGNGGNGYDVSAFIGGSTTYKAGGSGGGCLSGNTPGAAGNGGVAGTTNTTPSNAAANSGSGGGGGLGTTTTGNGGSGICYIRFRA